MKRGPLADSYPAAVALVVCALVPFLCVTASLTPLEQMIGKDLKLSRGALALTISLSDAAYAFGTVLAVQLAQRLPPRRMLLLYVSLFVAFAFVTAAAPARWAFIGAFIGEGLCTSLMLIAAVPPLVTGFPAARMPWTGAIMNLCIFGAVAAGPSIGLLFAFEKSWRTLFWIVAGISVLALVFALLTYEDEDPQNADAPWDVAAIALAAGASVAAFVGAAELEVHQALTARALVPLLLGLVLVLVLIQSQYRKENPLMPVEQLATTFPVVGISMALAASAAAFGLIGVALAALAQAPPGHAALLFLPEFAAALVTAGLFGALFRTRFTPAYALAGVVVLCAAAATLSGVAGAGDARIAVGAALLGLGVGASVSPGLFIAGFSLRSAQIQRVFALIELLRGFGAFLFAPVVAYLAVAIGFAATAWVCFAIAAAGGVLAVAVFVAGGARLQRPDLDRWQDENEPAWDSPPLLDRVY